MRARRLFSVIAVAAALCTALTACKSNVGVAARVNGTEISESSIYQYLVSQGQVTTADGQTINAPVTVLSALIQREIYTRLLDADGGFPSATDLAGVHDEALSDLFQTQVSGSSADQQLAGVLEQDGFTAKFVPVFIQTTEIREYAIEKLQPQTQADLNKAFAKLNLKIYVDSRYGTWSTANLDLAAAPNPDYLFVKPSASPSPSATPGA